MTCGSELAKRSYVAALRLVRRAVRPTGVLDRPAPPRSKRVRHWFRSLTAIHDVDELIALDVPWWVYGAIDDVESFLASRRSPRVFEFGSGASTVWLAKRAARVTSVEHDAGWCETLRGRLAEFDNVTVELVPPDSLPEPLGAFRSSKPGFTGMSFRGYVESIRKADPPFDLIVIDGRARSACLREAASHLAPDGMIVFDNSGRSRYREAIVESGLQVTTHRGLVPSLPVPDVTALLRNTE
ncbi:MAG: class I SAM-dependent methyltransferase [Dermatophilaceae bacterium]|nr:class I SAM-dependent methyltransferase [Intrasporangiaceae bacterium]